MIDDGTPDHAALDLPVRVVCAPAIVPAEQLALPHVPTEWVMLTSGTSGVPKMVVHSLASLIAPIGAGQRLDGAVVWGTFYDIRRYGGLQIFLRAIIGGASLVLSCAGEPIADHLDRLGRCGVTHLSGTPSHWRRALMSPEIGKISPRYVRLSGEIADQAILDSLRATFPEASIGHAYASTEAGVAFEVDDGRAGFPADFLDNDRDGVELETRRWRAAHPLAAHGAALSRRATCVARPRRFRRYRRHGGAARRSLRLRRPARRHHQCRRLEGSPRGDRGGHQSASTGANVAGAAKEKSRHRRDRDCRRRAESRWRALRRRAAKSRTTYWRFAAKLCRVTKSRLPSRSCRRSMSRRPANWRGAMAEKTARNRSRHRRAAAGLASASPASWPRPATT